MLASESQVLHMSRHEEQMSESEQIDIPLNT